MRKFFLGLLGLIVPVLGLAQGVTVNNLPNGTSILGSNYTICDQSGVTNKCTYSQVLAYVIANLGVNNIVTVTGIPVVGDCAKFTSINSIGDAGAACGSGGGGSTPGGANFSFQYNNTGSLGGVLPGAPGTVCINYASLSVAPTLVACPGGGTVTSVSVTVPSPFATSGCTITSSGTCAITFSSGLTADEFLGTPCNTTGTVTLRVLCSQDIPNNAANTSGNANTATTATNAVTTTNIAGGLIGEFPYQTGANTTGFTPQPTVPGTSPVWNGSTYVFQAAAGSVNACGNSSYVAYYAAAGTVISCAPPGNALSFNGGVLNVIGLTDSQTGTTYAISSSDNSKLVTRTNAANMSDTIVAATTTGYTAGFAFDYTCYGPGVCTLTPTTSTIGGLTALVIAPNQGCSVTSDGTNYQVSACDMLLTSNQGGAGTSITPSCAIDNQDNFGTFTATGGTFTINAPTGCVPFEGQRLRLHPKFTNAQTYSFNAAFVGGTVALPTTSTGGGKGDWLGFLYDSINAKWDFVALAAGF